MYFRSNASLHAALKEQLKQKVPGLTKDMALGRRYFVDLLASTAMTRVQAESFSGTKGDGFPLAAMLAMVSVEQKNLVLIMEAHIYTVCPTAIPTLPQPRKDATEDEIMSLIEHYGIGAREPGHHAKAKVMPYECCAWKDICEDIGKAEDVFAGQPGGRMVGPGGGRAAQVYAKGVRY